ncbi:MAG: ATPase domain-containing protein [Sulfolobales archaeon]
MKGFVFGISALDNMYQNALYPGSLIVVAGHPGSGKTTLASTICYANAVRGYRCLYISLQETKEKLFRVMKEFNMDFTTLEEKGMYIYLKIPVMRSIEDVIEIINEAISNWNPKVVVVDSANVLIQAIADPDQRAWLQNYFYTIPEMIDGIAILIAELPFGKRIVELDSIEFVADAVIILRHRVERGLLIRYMEIRKIRGAPVVVAEMPFTIVSGKGIDIFVPPMLGEISEPGPELKPPCMVLDSILNHLHKGNSIYIEYPPDFRAMEAIPLILGIAFRNNLKVVIISYSYSPETMTDLLLRAYKIHSEFCNDLDKVTKIVENRVVFVSLNPYRYSLAEELAEEFRIIERSGADMIVFHSIEIPAAVEGKDVTYLQNVYNQINVFKRQQKLVTRIGSKINEEFSSLFSAMADVVMKFIPVNDYQDYKLYIWRRGTKPATLNSNNLDTCLKEIVSYICYQGLQSNT